MSGIAPAGHRARSRASRSDEGYTLIEILVVLMIIGIMSAVAIGSFSGVVRGMNDTYVSSTLQALRVQQSMGVVTGKVAETWVGPPHDVTLPGGYYAIGSGVPGTLATATMTDPLVGRPISIQAIRCTTGCTPTSGTAAQARIVRVDPNNIAVPSDGEMRLGFVMFTVGNPSTGLTETDFLLCGQYGDDGQKFEASTFQSVFKVDSYDLGCEPVAPGTTGGVLLAPLPLQSFDDFTSVPERLLDKHVTP